jgi:uncharacterized membrane protein YkvI
MDTVTTISKQFETQSLNAVVAGFSFASAIAWMEAVRWILSNVIKTNKNGGIQVLLTALFTTLLSIVVYMVLSRVSKNVAAPQSPVYAVSGAR